MVPVLSSCAADGEKGSPNGSYSCDWLNWLAMRFDLITIFPEFFAGPLDHGILRRARETGLAEVNAARKTTRDPKTATVLLSAGGKLFDQETARRYARLERILFICGRYEGVDERVAQHLATEEISIGNFVLSGGELPAMVVIDAVARLIPGALGNEASSQNESFSATEDSSGDTSHQPRATGQAILDFPHYTRPAEYRGWSVPEVLIGGNHAEVAKWRKAAAIEKTQRNRPDLAGRE